MKEESRAKMAKAGRRFEITQLMVDVGTCDCCGATKPFSVDPVKNANTEFAGAHLRGKYYPALKCDCTSVCKGEQFYVGKQMEAFMATHTEHHVIPPYNASVCHGCNKWRVEDDGFLTTLARPFSKRNWFGPVSLPPVEGDRFANVAVDSVPASAEELEVELRWVLASLTMAEEAAIRRVTPLATLVRLKHGNIGSKGVVSCVAQSTAQLASVLPRLPTECKTIVFQYERKNGDGGSFRCRRRFIGRALFLLQQTRCEPWLDVTVSMANLAHWPVDGNILDQMQNADVGVSGPGAKASESGPAPGQNVDEAGFEIVGATMGASSVDVGDQLQRATDRLDALGGMPREPVALPDAQRQALGLPVAGALGAHSCGSAGSSAGPQVDGTEGVEPGGGPPIMTADRSEKATKLQRPADVAGVQGQADTAKLRQSEWLPTAGFVNMKTTPWAWAMAFPTLFPPSFENGHWVTRGDPVGVPSQRMRLVAPTLHEWANYCMWRSDGGPARHPTFAVVLNAILSQSQLQSQGQTYLHRSSVDPDLTLEQFQTQYADKGGNAKFRQGLMHSVGNVRGTDQYWNGVRGNFKAGNFFLRYAKKKEQRYFATGSYAEFHDPFLRVVLGKYVSKVWPPRNRNMVDSIGMAVCISSRLLGVI